ncbi:MAG TPA: acylphosphatase [Microbacterium sp.]|uniref:acylphosphatase n=1 Tax=Microbacterium sp. TaxID=51671 RepID=UPI002F9572CD
MRRVHVTVRGDVQGVGYRYTLRMVVRDAGAAGWVRNRRDGSVEAELEGTPGQVDEVLAWMAEGPPGARVEDATVTDAEATGERGFEVLPTQ